MPIDEEIRTPNCHHLFCWEIGNSVIEGQDCRYVFVLFIGFPVRWKVNVIIGGITANISTSSGYTKFTFGLGHLCSAEIIRLWLDWLCLYPWG